MGTFISNVGLYDMESGNQIGECWLVEVQASTAAEAIEAVRKAAWGDVDSRLNDVRIDVIDCVEVEDYETEEGS